MGSRDFTHEKMSSQAEADGPELLLLQACQKEAYVALVAVIPSTL